MKNNDTKDVSADKNIIEERFKCLHNFNDETVLHYLTKQEMADIFEKYGSMDWRIGDEKDLGELTADMAGFGTKRSQRVIIDYDKNYGKFLVLRVYKDYEASSDAP